MIAGTTVTLTFDVAHAVLATMLVILVWLAVSWTPGPRLEQTTWGQLEPGDVIHDPDTGDDWTVQSWHKHTDAWNPTGPPKHEMSVESVREDGMEWRATRHPDDAVLRHGRDLPGVPA